MFKRLLIVTLLFSLFSIPALADSGKHLVLFKGSAAKFAKNVEVLGGEIEYSHNKTGFAVVNGLSESGIESLSSQKSVVNVMPDFNIELEPDVSENRAIEAFGELATAEDPTTASFYPRQWHLRAIDADLAWARGRLGSPYVTVAVLDTGIAYTAPDLAGLVDLDRSVSFVPADDEYVEYFFPGYHLVTDIHYHGTHVASTIASNGLVAAGVTSKTTLMGVKVCSAVLGNCPGSAIFAGLAHAVDNGADVANMSLGGGFLKAGAKGYGAFINKFFNYARSMGMTIVVSAGNDSIDLDHNFDPDPEEGGHFPTLYKTYCDTPSTICVSATAPASQESTNGPWTDVDAPASYTNYGRSAVNVAAPGGNNPSWVYATCSNTSLVIPVCQTGDYIVGIAGTSMAAPHVSGLAALVVEDVGRSPAKVRAAIQKNADDLGQKGTDPFYGKGRINVNNTID